MHFLQQKGFVFWFQFHWSLFLRVQLTISEQWFTNAYMRQAIDISMHHTDTCKLQTNPQHCKAYLTLMAIIRTIILVPFLSQSQVTTTDLASVDFITWWSVICRFHPRVPHLLMNCIYLITWQGTWQYACMLLAVYQGPLLLTWINFDPSMDK